MKTQNSTSKNWNSLVLIYMIFSGVSILILTFKIFGSTNHKIIRAEGIVIHDAEGKDRILIGAPIPYSADRVRTDTSKVRSAWGKTLGEDYLNNYDQLHHGTNGMVVLNKEGFDKIALGDQLTDPNTGKRIAENTGMVWNDDEGYERGGIGLNKLLKNQKYRTGMGLDDDNGEGLHTIILEDGSRFIRFAYEDGYMLIGKAAANNQFFENIHPFVGILIRDSKDSTLLKINAYEKKN